MGEEERKIGGGGGRRALRMRDMNGRR